MAAFEILVNVINPKYPRLDRMAEIPQILRSTALVKSARLSSMSSRANMFHATFEKIDSNPYGLYDLTVLSQSSQTSDPVVPPGVRGWKIELQLSATSWEGEKVLSESRTFDNTIYFSTFTPNNSVSASACSVQSGTNKLHAIKTFHHE